MAAAKIKKGDTVVVRSGKDKGRTGTVLQVMPKEGKVLVSGVNVATRHRKPTQASRAACASKPGTARRSAWPSSPGRRSMAKQDSGKYVPRLRKKYDAEIAKAMTEKFGYKNALEVPKIEKITLNMGVGEASQDKKKVQTAAEEMELIAGQKPVITKAKKSIAQFKLREGMPIGAHVTLRGDRMWEFLDRLLSLALPRIRDFRGLNPNQFDGRGNYTFGLTEQVMFHEINQDRIDRSRGMDITVVTTATTDDQGRALLKQLGFPFKEN